MKNKYQILSNYKYWLKNISQSNVINNFLYFTYFVWLIWLPNWFIIFIVVLFVYKCRILYLCRRQIMLFAAVSPYIPPPTGSHTHSRTHIILFVLFVLGLLLLFIFVMIVSAVNYIICRLGRDAVSVNIGRRKYGSTVLHTLWIETPVITCANRRFINYVIVFCRHELPVKTLYYVGANRRVNYYCFYTRVRWSSRRIYT